MQKTTDLITVKGTIQAIRTVDGVQNLVEDIQKGALFTGAAAAIAGQAGMVANAAALALYDGEVVTNVALLINGQLAVGTFEWLQDLEVDDEVKLVVSQIEDGPLYIHAILRKKDQLLWTPYSIDHTRFGWIMHGVKMSGLIVVLMWLMFGVVMLFNLDLLPDRRDLVWLIIGPIILMAIVGTLSTSGMSGLGEQAEDIFKALGVPKYERFRIKPFSIMNLHFVEDPDSLSKKYIFKFADALAAHKKKFNLP